jgi:hypothetical protein
MAHAKTSLRAEKQALRAKMRGLGLGYDQIAAEFGRRYRLRPRTAWREAYGWSLNEAAQQINACKGQVGLDPGGIASMTGSHLCEHENWPGPGATLAGRKPTPYLLALLAAVYRCTVLDLVDLADREHLPAADLLVLDTYHPRSAEPPQQPARTPQAPGRPEDPPAPARRPDAQARGGVLELRPADCLDPVPAPVPAMPARAYRWIHEPDTGHLWIEREVVTTAHESSDHAEQAEQRDIGDSTLEQMRADVIRLSAASMTGEPFAMFGEMRRVRDRIYAALERRLWPRDASELYLLLGCLNNLMAVAAEGLGYPQAAEELLRAGWAYAVAIDHRPLMALLRQQHASIAYWNDRARQSRDLAASGLTYLSDGENAAHLQVKYARAAARLGDSDGARRAITAAGEAREREHTDEVLEMGGEFGLSLATQHYFAGAALAELEDAQDEAAAELENAASLYAAGPRAGEQHWFGGSALTGGVLAAVQLRMGRLDAAAVTLEPVLSLPVGQRISALTGQLAQVRTELRRPRYQGSPQARTLDERIEDFGRDTIVTELHSLPIGPA